MIEKPLYDLLIQKKIGSSIPFWFMRQAGRYLPEYREIRSSVSNFLDLCFSPDLAKEITLQPLRRFDMDGAILFSDILVVPYGLGQKVWFENNKGPCLDPIRTLEKLEDLSFDDFKEKLDPVYETVQKIDHELENHKTLIGFAGAPWTVSTYMVEGGSSKTFYHCLSLAYQNPSFYENLIEKLEQATYDHLDYQIKAGVKVVQIFESWASVLPSPYFEKYCVKPVERITKKLKENYPDIPIILFAKGAHFNLELYKNCSIDGLGLDSTLSLSWVEKQKFDVVYQGNLDPMFLCSGGDEMLKQAKKIIDFFSGKPFIFNLGHGVIKETPVEHVDLLSQFIKSYHP